MMKRILSILMALTLSLAFVACSSNKPKENMDEMGQVMEGDGDIDSSMVDKLSSDMGNAMGLDTINFAFDSFQIPNNEMEAVRNNARILNENPSVNVQIEGHCDERGSVQYNLALGDKRAKAVKRAMQRLGVAPSRIDVISFGKEQPLDPGSNEAAWAMNRRANFVITAK